MKQIKFKLVWFDSLGAKSSCTLMKTPDVCVLIDPGIAVMQPSFPASWTKKLWWREQGKSAIKKVSKKADVIIISHYHYDHYMPNDLDVYANKLLLVKNPNEYINDSQRARAWYFFDNLCKKFGGIKLEKILKPRQTKIYPDPLDNLPLANSKDFKDYNPRRKQLLKQGKTWFLNRTKKWNEFQIIPPLKFRSIQTQYPEGKEFRFGSTLLRFTPVWFHGIEYSRVGWVFATIVQYKQETLIHSSDLNGIYIEDYAQWLIQEDPHVLILDGPPTYMYGYMLNSTNLERCIANACRIIKESANLKLLIYDHHLLREAQYKERTKAVWEAAKTKGIKIMTAAQHLRKTPVI
jgi:hypothetical protein